jgi:hypothetical protein
MYTGQFLPDGSTLIIAVRSGTRYLLTPTSEGRGIVNLWREGYLQRWHSRRAAALDFIERSEAHKAN